MNACGGVREKKEKPSTGFALQPAEPLRCLRCACDWTHVSDRCASAYGYCGPTAVRLREWTDARCKLSPCAAALEGPVRSFPGLTSLAAPFHLANEPALVSIPRWIDPLRDGLDRLTSDGRDARRTIEKFGTAATAAAATLRAG